MTTGARQSWGARVALVFAIGAAAGLGFWLGRDEVDPSAETTTVVRPSPSVVVAVRELSRLEGAVYHIERVVDLEEKQSKFFGMVEAEDAILLVAAGEVMAGVDLSQLPEGAVRADFEARSVSIQLPRAVVLSHHLDSERTYVHTRRTGLLATRKENLETRARQEAERTLEEAAVRSGLLRQAESSVRRTVEGLLRSLGFERVEVRFEGDGGEANPTGRPTASPAPAE